MSSTLIRNAKVDFLKLVASLSVSALVLGMTGCSGAPSAANSNLSQLSAESSVLAATPITGGGAITLQINPMDGHDQAVQYLPRGRKVSDIQSYRFELLNAADNSIKFTLNPTGAVKGSYTISNIPAPATLKIRVLAYSGQNQTGTVLNKVASGAISAGVSVVDQAIATTTVALQLADGATANGDISATVNITEGTETTPTPTID